MAKKNHASCFIEHLIPLQVTLSAIYFLHVGDDIWAHQAQFGVGGFQRPNYLYHCH